MKAPSNNSADFFAGPGTNGALGLRAGDVPCRVVADLVFRETESPFISIIAYLTIEMDEFTPDGPLWQEIQPGEWTVDWAWADRVAFPTGAPIQWVVARVETADPDTPGSVPYYRVHLVDADDVGGVDGGGGEPDYGADLYFLSPWGILLYRSGPLSWGDFPGSDTILTADGEGYWELLDVGDGITYLAASWNGSGTKTFVREDEGEGTVDVIEQ